VNVGLESGPERLYRHDNARSIVLFLFSTASMAADLGRHPPADDAVDQARDLPVQAGVALETLAQAHSFRQSDDEMAVVTFGELLGQGVAEALCSAVDAGWADSCLARKWDGHVDFAIGAVQQRQAIARIAAAQQLLHDFLGLQGQRPVGVLVA